MSTSNLIGLTDGQLNACVAALECWVEGYEDATNDVIHDRSLDSPEQLCDAVAGMHEDFAHAVAALGILRVAQKEVVG